jgi:hypothetical protein
MQEQPKRDPRNIPFAPGLRKEIVRAVQAISDYAAKSGEGPDQPGPPSPRDCKLMLDWLIGEVCRSDDVPFFASDPGGRMSAFMQGRQYVGKEVRLAMQLKPELLKN